MTSIGKIVDKYINCINDKYPSVFVDNYVIMPNHIHLLLAIAENNTENTKISSVIGWFKYFVTKVYNADSIEKVPVFQRSYHDHIIRNDKSYQMIYDYINNNPSVWYSDCYFSEQ
ncbi:MAG: transposase [Oscillospiraceae bacterium]|nr:transposase [Oscillospiraceae bacterium]